MRFRSICCGAAATLGVLACGRGGADSGSKSSDTRLRVSLDSSLHAGHPRIVLTGLTARERTDLRDARWPSDRWTALMRVAVGRDETTAVAGAYTVDDTVVAFQPRFPFDAGRVYSVRVDPSQLPAARRDSATVTDLALSAPVLGAPSTTVVRVLPSSGELPENVLRLYIEFSAPMSRRAGIDFVQLVDEQGHVEQHAFLPLDADFWNPAHTRYTLFLDPGRVKRGILPNEQMGRPLRVGHEYTLVIDSTWPDDRGLPLAASFRRKFRVGPAVTAPIALASWTIQPPNAGSRDPLAVTFPRPLDHGLLQRALGVESAKGKAILGTVAIGADEVSWRFTPREPWSAGEYRLIAFSILEDPAGNRIGRAFEVDIFDRADSTSTAERYSRPFTVK